MPILERRDAGGFDFERLWLGLLVLAAAAGAAWLHFRLPLPGCLFLALTGVPCLTCGGTRCVKSLLAGDVASAFAWNPLVLAVLVAAGLFALYALAVIAFGLPRLRLGAFTSGERNFLRVALALVLAANWIYLIVRFSGGA